MKCEKVLLYVTEAKFTAGLPHPIFWDRCYLEKTNLKAAAQGSVTVKPIFVNKDLIQPDPVDLLEPAAASGDLMVQVSIDKVNMPFILTTSEANMEVLLSFVIANDSFNHPANEANMAPNADSTQPLTTLNVQVSEYENIGFMLLRFEKD